MISGGVFKMEGEAVQSQYQIRHQWCLSLQNFVQYCDLEGEGKSLDLARTAKWSS